MSTKGTKASFFEKLNLPSLFIGTIVTIVITTIFEPLFTALYDWILNLGWDFIKFFSDSIYQEISNGYREQIALYITEFLFFICCFLSYFLGYHFSTVYKNKLQELLLLQKDIFELYAPNSELSQNESSETSETLDQTEQAELVKDTQDFVVSQSKKYSRYYRLALIGFLVLYLMNVLSYARVLFINNAITATTNNIEIVAPYISDQEYKQLKSDFHSIQNKEDYDLLYNTLYEIAEKHSLSLKK